MPMSKSLIPATIATYEFLRHALVRGLSVEEQEPHND